MKAALTSCICYYVFPTEILIDTHPVKCQATAVIVRRLFSSCHMNSCTLEFVIVTLVL